MPIPADLRPAPTIVVDDRSTDRVPPADITLSVVVPCWSTGSVLGHQLAALDRQSRRPHEVVLADNGGHDDLLGSVDVELAERLRLRVVDATDRPGASHARNVGADAATGSHLGFVDADDLIADDWVERIELALAEDDFVASRFEHAMLNVRRTSYAQVEGLQQFRTPFVPFAGGCGLAIRRDLHLGVGGFDESMLALEDADYCIRIQLAGTPLAFADGAVVHIRNPEGVVTGWWGSRRATYRKSHAWSYGMGEIFVRYRSQGMTLPGILPRLGLLVPLVARFLATGSHQSVWRIGWHAGAIRRLAEHRSQRVRQILRRPLRRGHRCAPLPAV